MNQDSQVLISVQNGVGQIVLNRPKALNALSLEMIRQISTTLDTWGNDEGVEYVVFRGAGDRAFCAGGDVKSFYRSGMEYRRGQSDIKVPTLFFAEEYSLNKQIFEYPKQTIALIDGIVMGGGAGIASHCKHRLVSEDVTFAMPEVGIGFFPDIGSAYYLSSESDFRHFITRYIALTGAHVGAGDMIAAGMADACLHTGSYDRFLSLLEKEGIEEALKACLEEVPHMEAVQKHGHEMEKVFQTLDVLEICDRLRESDSDWAKETLELILSRSPISVMVTAQHLKNLVDASFDTVIDADFCLAQRFVEYSDMYEGIRALLIDKDNDPSWQRTTLADVTEEDIARYFEPTGYGLADV